MTDADLIELAKYGLPSAFEEVAEKWLTPMLADGKAKSSLLAYGRALRLSICELASHHGQPFGIDDLTGMGSEDVYAFIQRLRAEGYAPSSINQRLTVIKRFCRHVLGPKGRWSAIEFVSPQAIPSRTRQVAHVDDTQDRLTLHGQNVEKEIWVQSRDIALAMLVGVTGAMLTEAVSIRRGEAKPDGINQIELKGAGRLARIAILPREVKERISTYLHQIPFELAPEDPLFVGARGGPLAPRLLQLALEQMEDQLGLPRSTTPSGLRTGAIILMFRQGLLDYEIASRLGLRSTASVARVLSENGCHKSINDIMYRFRNRHQPVDISSI